MSGDGVLKYERFYAVVKWHFPEGKVRCSFCDFYNENRKRCNLTQSFCFFPNERVNDDCPLVPEEETK